MIQKEAIVKEFQELTAIDSPSFGERKFADALRKKLEALGFSVTEDDTGKQCGGNAGNVYAYLEGTKEADPLLFSAHMDTVDPALGKEAVMDENGRITSRGDTVLGSDDVAGIVAILGGVRHVLEENIPHPPIELLFPFAEEKYSGGAAFFDYSTIRAKEAYVLDSDGAPGTAILQEPTLISFEITVEGKAAHAGFEPERGVNAIAAAARAINAIKQGWPMEGVTLNIGTIKGGKANNIVADACKVTGESRSHDAAKAQAVVESVRQAFEDNLGDASFTMTTDTHLVAYKVPEDHPVVTRFLAACKACGFSGELTTSFGGSDNNMYMRNGITGILLSCGMHDVHTTKEYTTADELYDSARLVAALLQS